jgi:hypothetical protein
MNSACSHINRNVIQELEKAESRFPKRPLAGPVAGWQRLHLQVLAGRSFEFYLSKAGTGGTALEVQVYYFHSSAKPQVIPTSDSSLCLTPEFGPTNIAFSESDPADCAVTVDLYVKDFSSGDVFSVRSVKDGPGMISAVYFQDPTENALSVSNITTSWTNYVLLRGQS